MFYMYFIYVYFWNHEMDNPIQTLRVNKIAMEKFLKKSVIRTLNCRNPPLTYKINAHKWCEKLGQ